MRPSIDAASEVGTPLPGWANAPNGMHLGRDTLTVLHFWCGTKVKQPYYDRVCGTNQRISTPTECILTSSGFSKKPVRA